MDSSGETSALLERTGTLLDGPLKCRTERPHPQLVMDCSSKGDFFELNSEKLGFF
jgi:hypothetical protein